MPREYNVGKVGGVGEGLHWPWGNEWREGCDNTAETGLLKLCPTGRFPARKSPVGCFDMIGQTYEWSASLYQPYPYDRDDGREDPLSTGPRTLRGCAWSARGSYFTRAAYRFLQPPEHRHSDIGFRCVQDLQPSSPEFDARVESADEVPDFQPVDFELMMKEQLFSSAAANFDADSLSESAGSIKIIRLPFSW